MTRNQIRITLLSGFALVAALIASRPVAAQDAKQPYPNMAPIKQYLMDRDAEIALARSAAPDAISHDVSVIVLTRHGYETAVEGKNGWVCWVGRGWMGMFDHPEFWNPKVRAQRWTISDHATFEKPMEPSVGVHYLLVAGTVVVNEGKIVPDVFPGRALLGRAGLHD